MLTWIVRNTITCTIVRNNKGRKSINAAGIRSKKQLQTFSFCFSPMLSLNSHTLALSASKRKARVLCKIDILLLYISAGSGTNGQQTKTVWGELEKIPTRLMEKLRHSHSGRPTSGFFFPCYDTLLKKVNSTACSTAENWSWQTETPIKNALFSICILQCEGSFLQTFRAVLHVFYQPFPSLKHPSPSL